jgi:hypothetical protein
MPNGTEACPLDAPQARANDRVLSEPLGIVRRTA